jgi:hypothetical protein
LRHWTSSCPERGSSARHCRVEMRTTDGSEIRLNGQWPIRASASFRGMGGSLSWSMATRSPRGYGKSPQASVLCTAALLGPHPNACEPPVSLDDEHSQQVPVPRFEGYWPRLARPCCSGSAPRLRRLSWARCLRCFWLDSLPMQRRVGWTGCADRILGAHVVRFEHGIIGGPSNSALQGPRGLIGVVSCATGVNATLPDAAKRPFADVRSD